MKIKNNTLLLIIVLVILSNKLFAIDYYISPSGNDSNIGTTTDLPWQTISQVNSINIKPGDRILFEGGQTFPGDIYLDSNDANNPDNIVTISSYGTGSAIIYAGDGNAFYAYNTQGFTISNLIFEGSGINTNTADAFSIYADVAGDLKFSNITIKNIEIRNFGKHGVLIGSWNGNTGFKDLVVDNIDVHNVKSNGIFTYGFDTQTSTGSPHQNITIKYSRVHDVPGFDNPNSHSGSGIIMGQVDGGLIEHCVAYNNGSGNTHCGGPGGIWAYSCNNLIIQFCESYHNSSGTGCDGVGFDFDGGVTNSLLQYNYSHNNDGAGFLLGQYDGARPWGNNIVRFNISENDGRTNAGGITLFKGSNTTMEGLKIYHNTVYITPSSKANEAFAAFSIADWNGGINGVEVYNNIFQTTGGVPLIIVPSGYSAYFAGNLYWTNGGSFKISYQGTTYTDLSEWRSATGNEEVKQSPAGLEVDPMLSNVSKGQIVYPNAPEKLNAYKLADKSPAINCALDLKSLFNINSGTRDFFNNKLTNGVNRDIGAHFKNVAVLTATIIALGATTFCQGDSVILKAGTASSYLWSNGEKTQSIVVKTSGNYSVKVTNAEGSTATSKEIAVIVNPSPIATISPSGNITLCKGDSITLTAGLANTYKWSTGANTPSIKVKSSGNYYVEVSNSNGCKATSQEVIVLVSPLPTATITTNGRTEFCEGDSVVLIAGKSDSYIWNTGAITQAIVVKTTGKYSVIVKNTNGCSAVSEELPISVYELPYIPIITVEDNVLSSNYTYGNQWYFNDAKIDGAVFQTYTAQENGVYSVAFTNSNGCSAISEHYNLVIQGVNEVADEDKLLIKPNPVHDIITITESNDVIKIYDMFGRELKYMNNGNNQRIDISFLKSGIYIIKTNNKFCKFVKL